LALLLIRQERIDEAHDQAKICVLLEPANQEYCALLREINRTILSSGHLPQQDWEEPLQGTLGPGRGTAADGDVPPPAAG
jgi:hypothetical protein